MAERWGGGGGGGGAALSGQLYNLAIHAGKQILISVMGLLWNSCFFHSFPQNWQAF